MVFRYRKSKNFGPFRINLSKSGVGWSVGGKGFRYTKKANGGSRTNASIPGSGISWVKDSSRNNTINNTSKKIVDKSKHPNDIYSPTQNSNGKFISTKALIILAFVIIIISIFFY
ncbi:DUF4236 domain-containing protein [Weissella confusa]|uniref:DUF4236 domain-containing protein n=1 Tax=Weissella confusa TaxID=1583 RepID=UPI0018F13024|nr:DUF4236 domain-containing protein [Weissella confusa]MBJ7623069.1 DUF4236 domain-containing protein [Weissella confusa]